MHSEKNKLFRLLFFVIVTLAMAALQVTPAYAATKTSTGAGGAWHTAGTWSPSGVPANNDTVIIAQRCPKIQDNLCDINMLEVLEGHIRRCKNKRVFSCLMLC